MGVYIEFEWYVCFVIGDFLRELMENYVYEDDGVRLDIG